MLIFAVSALALACAGGICFFTGSFGSLDWLWVLPLSFLGSFLVLALMVFLIIWIACALVDLNKPQERDSKFYRFLLNLIAEAALPIMGVRMHTQGLEKMPQGGRFLLVCNHLNEMDPVILFHYFRKHRLVFGSKRENATMFLVGKLMHKIRCPLINRENDREALKAILRCIELLKEDTVSIGIFPEGHITDDKKLDPLKGGVFKIAQKAQVPVVVCTLQNTHHVFHNAARLKKTDVQLHLVDVIPAEELKGVTAVDVAHRVHKLMADDLGPDLVASAKEES
ncbi:MAG: 1-acyl-sn-glycerol-3-phosphate acyltransferase [Oscillospiraceae bacterium]|nr:1-acyl-sn-glycerol-3-phosphate acyltransferase [Oscillospiraceae bacterium]